MKFTVENLITSYYIKYAKLSELTMQAYSGSKAETVNLIIDMYPIYRDLLLNPDKYEIEDKLSITYSIINMCAHYRDFYKSKGVYAMIYINSSFNRNPMNDILCRGYNEPMKTALMSNIQMKEFIEYNIDILNIVCDYLPNIFFNHTSYENGVLAKRIIVESYNDKVPNIILTKDLYQMQLLNSSDNACILRPLKHNGDNSYCITDNQEVFWNTFCKVRNIKTFEVLPDPHFITIVNGLSRVPERFLKGYMTAGSVVNKILSLISLNLISDSNIDVENIVNNLQLNESTPEIINRIKAIDLDFQYNVYMKDSEAIRFSRKNLYDPEGVKQLNETYFKNNLLDLDRL